MTKPACVYRGGAAARAGLDLVRACREGSVDDERSYRATRRAIYQPDEALRLVAPRTCFGDQQARASGGDGWYGGA